MMRGYPGYGPGIGAGHLGLFGGLFSGLFVLVMIAAVIALIVLLIRRPHHGQPGMHGQVGPTAADPYADALAVAARRLANGEITPAQYEEIRRTLYGAPPADTTPPAPPSPPADE